MHNTGAAKWPAKAVACALMFTLSLFSAGLPAQAGDPDKAVDKIKTASPIKHVIIIVGENRSFDHLFATFSCQNTKTRKSRSQPSLRRNPSTPMAHRARISPRPSNTRSFPRPNGGKFFSSADLVNKQLYTTLPPPDVNGVGAVSALSRVPYSPAAIQACFPRTNSFWELGHRL